MTDKTFKAGDTVKWDHSQGTTQGKVIKKVTSPTRIKGHKVAASADDPQYVVETDEGRRAAHKPQALTRE